MQAVKEEMVDSQHEASSTSDGGDGPDLGDRNGQHHPIAEFLYQLTKMLMDDNSEIIEWSDGRIKVHYPDRLEAEVLHKYFRHSKFASFQRQLNYFGFRKIAGKGKMSPCSYVNEAATSDIRSLLLIKRKTNGSAARKAAEKQRAAAAMATSTGMNPVLAAGLGFPPALVGNMNNQALTNAMALLSENALRAGMTQMGMQQGGGTDAATANAMQQQLGLLALQHQQAQQLQQLRLQQQQQAQHQQQQQAQHQQHQQQPKSQQDLQRLLGQHLQQQQQQQMARSNGDTSMQQHQQNTLQHRDSVGSNGDKRPAPAPLHAASTMPSVEQLRAHLASDLGGLNAGMLRSHSFGLASQAAAALSQQSNNGAKNATAALSAQGSSMPATAAFDEATSQPAVNVFESAANLKSLLQEHSANEQLRRNASTGQTNPLLNRLPSSGTIFPDLSTASFGNLLGSSNRLNSLLSLNSLMGSREASLADIAAAMPVGAQLTSNAIEAKLRGHQ